MQKTRLGTEPEACWKEKDMANGEIVPAMVVIFRTSGCCWAKAGKGGCTMCGYRSASLPDVSSENLHAQLDAVMGKYSGEPFVKLYTSGSFLDEKEIPQDVRDRIFDEFKGCSRILFESRPEFVIKDSISSLPKQTTIALGLESQDEKILETCVNKGFTPTQSKNAGITIKDQGLGVRTYLLLKPPYIGERKQIEDQIESAKFADPFSDEISINPLNVQNATVVERLWKRGEFRSPWIWSLIEVLKSLSGTVNARLMSSPSGGGSSRGVHNCGVCDRKALDAIEKFSFTQNVSDLDVECECKSRWEKYMRQEELLGTAADVNRPYDDEMIMRM